RPLLRRKPALPPVSAVPARPVLVRATAIKPPVPPPALKKQLEQLVKVAQAEQRSALEKVASARKVFPSLLPLLKKKLPEKAARLPAVPTRPAKRYKEPVDWGRLLRRNAFRLVFLLLLLIWVGEIVFFTMRSKSADELFQEITGAAREETAAAPAAPPVEKPGVDITFKSARVDIEGRRDPFSPGVLKMEVIRRPFPTQIALARPPEVISILKTPKIATPSTTEEKTPVVPRTATVPQITPPPRPQITAPAKPPEVAAARVTSERVLPTPEVQAPTVSPLIVPERKCTLTYRGRMLMEGMEYFFLEGEKRTYRATLGEEVEGYRLLKKEQDKLYLSKDGHIYEMGTK
ncbi:MAG TPA: hypothetical protein PKX93_06125, partial [bacterium]|nr:hypothetical protein [bacterium]